jgi:type II secretory pathway component HofQ
VNNGATTIIGGILTNKQISNLDRTPGLHRIPLLGWLFRNEARDDENRELVIFLTPRIIKS